MATGFQQQVPYVRIVRIAIAGVLVDESFAIPTEEIKKYLSIAQILTKHFNCDVALHRCATFSNWLVNILEEVIRKSKNRSDMINSEKLWSGYHQITTSQSFRAGWEEFLGGCDVEKEPMIYQHITDEVFTKLVEQTVHTAVSEQNEQDDEEEPSLTYEEANAVSYVGGYVIHALMQKKLSQNCAEILAELKALTK